MSTKTDDPIDPLEGRFWYDHPIGIAKKLSGIDGLAEILRLRRRAHADGVLLRAWVVLDRLVLDDQGGICLRGEANRPNPVKESMGSEGRVLTRIHLPEPHAKCVHCGEGWTLRTLHDIYWSRSASVPVAMHRGCRELKVIQSHYDELVGILDRAGLSGCVRSSCRLVPSRYHDDRTVYGPWLLVETRWGTIEMGWRKNVIHLGWTDTVLEVTAEDLFPDENVTKNGQMIHAWGQDTAVRYLRVLGQGLWL